jgi:hypothetical protein
MILQPLRLLEQQVLKHKRTAARGNECPQKLNGGNNEVNWEEEEEE